jgi:hypothetical protein
MLQSELFETFDISQVEIDYSDPIDLEWLECMNSLKEQVNRKLNQEVGVISARC